GLEPAEGALFEPALGDAPVEEFAQLGEVVILGAGGPPGSGQVAEVLAELVGPDVGEAGPTGRLRDLGQDVAEVPRGRRGVGGRQAGGRALGEANQLAGPGDGGGLVAEPRVGPLAPVGPGQLDAVLAAALGLVDEEPFPSPGVPS